MILGVDFAELKDFFFFCNVGIRENMIKAVEEVALPVCLEFANNLS